MSVLPASPAVASIRLAESALKAIVTFWPGPTDAWTASRASTRSFSVRWKSEPTATREAMIPAVPIVSRNLRPLRSTSMTATIVMKKLTSVKSRLP
jgi:hypothetical protein